MTILLPPGWPRPRGYSCGVVAEGATVYVSGQVGWDEQGRFVSDDFVPQVRRALENVVAVLAAGGAGPEHIVRLTWYVTDKAAYLANLPEIGLAYRATIGRHLTRSGSTVVAPTGRSVDTRAGCRWTGWTTLEPPCRRRLL